SGSPERGLVHPQAEGSEFRNGQHGDGSAGYRENGCLSTPIVRPHAGGCARGRDGCRWRRDWARAAATMRARPRFTSAISLLVTATSSSRLTTTPATPY